MERVMSIPLERLEFEALELTVHERAALVRTLIASLDVEADDDPAEVELAWEEEIRRRIDEYQSGTVQPVSSADVFARARALLK
jgi:putative addiction module component (TIGR02574 family)